ncbi:MAG: nucleoside recognition domain-containing protein [Candidatus Fermentibacteria bacterium]|nr:nucleoside recognition domain-containing protein [Candidatus Fermentibacteria bacterium]
MLQQVIQWFWALLRRTAGVCLDLFKVMVPALIAVKILEVAGIFGPIADAIAPVMELAGLPGEAGLAWVTGMLSNMYGGLTITAGMIQPLQLNTAQVTTLGCMLLISHSLPVEITIAARAGVKPWFLIPFRLLTGLLFGIILGQIFKATGTLQGTPTVVWSAAEQGAGLVEWVVGIMRSMATIFFVILGVLGIMDLLDKLGIMALLKRIFRPAFSPMGIGDEASTITVIGLVLGISYGGGMIIRQASRGHIPPRQILASVSFMSICHAVIEDTFLVASLGVWAVAALPGRILYSWLIMFLLLLVSRRLSDRRIMQLCKPPEISESV